MAAHGDTGVLELVETVPVDDGAPQPMTSEGDGLYRATVATTTADTQATTSTTDAPALAADHDDANGTWLLILMAVIVAAMITLAIAFVRGRRPSNV